MNISSFEHDLNSQTTCEVRFDSISRIAYSVDASIYEIEPMGIVLPRTKNDLINAVKIAYQYQIPVIARGAATGITGGCIGQGLIIDTSKHLNHILEINYESKYAVVEPGIIQDQLNDALATKGYRLGPDTSTGDRATLGGMTANNSAGARSLRYGKMVDHILALEVCLADGELIEFEAVESAQIEKKIQQQDAEGRIYKCVVHIRDTYRDEIEQRYPKIPRRVSGYNLDELIKPDPLNISKLITGSEGTLGIITKIKVAIAPLPKCTALCLVQLDDLLEGMRAVEWMLHFNLLSLELIDDQILERGRQAPSMRGRLNWLVGEPKALITAEFEGNSLDEAIDQAKNFQNELQKKKIGSTSTVLSDSEQMAHVRDLRKAGLGLLLSRRTYSRAIAFIEDISIPPEKIASFMERLIAYLQSKGKQAGIYGHVGSGCMHIRPYMDLRHPEELKLMKTMMLDVSTLLLEFGGALSGEHGDGLIRSWLNPKMYGNKLYQAFTELKSAFDPDNRMNPGKIVAAPPLEDHLRTHPQTKFVKIPTYLDFSKEGGFELAADLCNGNALCRKKHHIMCPSFQATGDEYDTTRARAQALRAIIHEHVPLEKMQSQEVYDVLDLCLECKGCKTECPSNVDMAKMKAEVLYQYQKKHGLAWRNWIFGHIAELFRAGTHWPWLFNKGSQLWLTKKIMEWIGISPQRSLPALAQITLSHWFQNNNHTHYEKKVVLFNDTFSQFIEPEIGISAIQVLNAIGYEVLLPEWHCCGRPLFSKGMLKEAKSKALKLVAALVPYARENIPIIGLEPSCLSMLTDDYEGLLGNTSELEQIKCVSTSFDEFISKHPVPFKGRTGQIYVHGHCHQKALVGMEPTLHVLKAIHGMELKEIPSGCCGMAGSFGYEKEHYALSLKIAELKLAPVVRSAPQDAVIIANGLSCRTQIFHTTGRKAYHLAEFLAPVLDKAALS